MKTALCVLALAAAAFAQVPDTTFDEAQPNIFVGVGIGLSPYATSTLAVPTAVDALKAKASLLGTFAVRIKGPILSWSTLQMTATQTTGANLRTGLGWVVKQQGAWSLVAIGDAGIAQGNGVTLAAFSAGGLATFEVNKPNHLYVTAGVSLVSISGTLVQPSFGCGFVKGF